MAFSSFSLTFFQEVLRISQILVFGSVSHIHLLPLQYSPALSLRVDGDSAVHGDIINTEQLLLAIDCGILHGMFYPHQNVVHHVRFHCGHQSPAQ